MDYKRVPLSSKERSMRKGIYPYYGAQGVIDYIDDYIFDGTYLLIAEDGENLKSQKQNIAQLASGKYWVNNHAHILESNGASDIRYLCYLLNSMDISGYITGSAQPKLNQANLVSIGLKLPPLELQRRIADVLSVFDNKMENNKLINDNFAFSLLILSCFILWLLKLINDNLQQQARALYKSWFVDFDPFKDGPFEDSELGMIPYGWSVKQLGEITTQVNERVKERVDVKVLSPITTGELVLSEEYFTKQVYSESISKYIVVKPSDFAYNPARVNIGSLGMNEYEFNGCVSPVYVVFRCEDGYQYFFDLFRRTETFKEEVRTRAIGGVRQSLAYKDFSLIKVVYPPIDVIHSFNQVYSRILAKTKLNNVETDRLASLRDTLLPKLMSGELKTNELTM